MIGRASIGYPWVFREIKHYMRTGALLPPPSLEERVNAARQHLRDSIAWKGPKLGVLEMRRHYTPYFRDLPHIKSWRMQLVTEDSPDALYDILDRLEAHYQNLASELCSVAH